MGLLKSIRDGLNAIRDKHARNQQINEELESYLGESINEKMRRGMAPKDAIRAARAEIGSAEVVKHKVWNAGWESWVERIWNDLRYTVRRLVRMPGLVVIVLLSIGIGVAANATIFSIVSKFLLQAPPVGQPATLVSLVRTYDHGRCCNGLPLPIVKDVQAQTQSLSGVAAYYELVPVAMGGGSKPELVWGQAATANFFDVLAANMTAGRGFLATEDKAPVIVLGYRLWQQKFGGDAGIVGKPLDVSGHVYTVVGIAPKG